MLNSGEQELIKILLEKKMFKTERTLLRKQRKILLIDFIGSGAAEDCVQDFQIIAADGHEPITLLIGSEGGEVDSGLTIFGAIKDAQAKKIKVIGKVFGTAMSMAFLILQMCDERIIVSSGWLMMHGVSSASCGDIKDTEAELSLLKGLRDQFAKMIASRNTSNEQLYHDEKYWIAVLESKTPKFVTAQESLDYGLIDRIE